MQTWNDDYLYLQDADTISAAWVASLPSEMRRAFDKWTMDDREFACVWAAGLIMNELRDRSEHDRLRAHALFNRIAGLLASASLFDRYSIKAWRKL